MAKKGIKVAAALTSLALTLTGAVTLSACGSNSNSSYADLLKERDSHIKEVQRIEKELDAILSREKEVDAVKDTIKKIEAKISYEKIDGPEVLSEIDLASSEVDEIAEKGIIDKSDATKMHKSLAELEKGVFYSVFANGITTRAQRDPFVERLETKANGVTLTTQTAVDFGDGCLVKNQATSADLTYMNVSVTENGLLRDCVVSETYKEEEGHTVSRKDFVESYKAKMKETIYSASDLSYDVTEGYKVVSTAEYEGDTLDTTIVYNVDENGALTTIDQTFENGDEVVAEMGSEFEQISSSKFSAMRDKALKTLDQQKQILESSDDSEK